MSSRESILAEHLGRHPSLAAHLSRLCDRCDKRGELAGTIKLADSSLPIGEYRALHSLFGPALKTSARGERRLDLTRFLASVPDADAWIEELYTALGRQRRDLVDEATQSQAIWQQLLGQFRLSYPDLLSVHRLLQSQSARHSLLDEAKADALRTEWFRLAETVRHLQANRQQVGLSDLGARFFNDSKTLRAGRLRTILCQWLHALNSEDAAEDIEPADMLSRYGVTDNPTSIKVTFFGPLRYRRNGAWLDWPCQLHRQGESTTLSLDNLAGIERAEFVGNPTVVTCENETPFNNLVREDTPFAVVYTGGFPNAAVRALLGKLPVHTLLRHWGDSDRAGYQIARILSHIHPLSLWRCQLDDLQRHRHALKPVSAAEQLAIQRALAESPDHPFAPELQFTAQHGWLEQESWDSSQ